MFKKTVVVVMLLLAGPAWAGDGDKDKKDKDGKRPEGVPEINAGSMAGGIALLAGGLLILTDKARKRSAAPRLSPGGPVRSPPAHSAASTRRAPPHGR